VRPIGGGYFDSFAILIDRKNPSVDGGTATSGAWRDRDLNTVAHAASWCSLNAGTGEYTLNAGTYHVWAKAPASRVGRHQARLYNVTAGATVAFGEGTSQCTGTGVDVVTNSEIDCVFTITATSTFKIQHQVANNQAGNGWGWAANFGTNERYTVVEIGRVK